MKSHFLVFILVGLCILIFPALPLVQGSLGTYEQGECVKISTILNSTWVNISTISYPNSTTAVSNVVMIQVAQSFTYNFCNTTDLGFYIYDYFDNFGNVYVNDFEITLNGKEKPSGIIVVLFIILFMVCLGFSSFMILYNIGHFFAFDFDIVDVAFNWGIYFIIVALYGLEEFYLGNPDIRTWLLWFISIGGFVLIFMPLLAFILSITVGTLSKKQMPEIMPRRKIWRRR